MNLICLNKTRQGCLCMAAFAALLLPAVSHAQYFNYTGRGELLAGFRKPGLASYELVVNLGAVTNFIAQPAGSTMPVSGFSPSQLNSSVGSLANVQWSVFAAYTGAPNSSWSGYKVNTIWFTLPRPDIGIQTPVPDRRSSSSQDTVRSGINSVGVGARTVSQQLVTTNDLNNTQLVREPADNASALSVFIGNPTDGTLGDFQGNMPSTVENVAPPSFTSPLRSDLYQSVPVNSLDPDSGTTSGPAYYVGYFTFNPDGTMTFTRASTVVAGPPPSPEIVSISRAGTTSTISFTTTNGTFNYSLRYTNASGLTAPVANWPALPTTVIGDGTTKQLMDTTSTSNRFYRVSVQ